MKHNVAIAVLCSALLAGCTTINQTDGQPPTSASGQPASAFSKDMNDNVNDVTQTASTVGTQIQAGAAEAADHAETLGLAVKDGYYESTDHIAGWFEPSTPKRPQSIKASYCYHVYQDILCYRQPMPGWEGRLAGYQPLNAPPPPPAVMQPMPKTVVDATQLPANRVASAKPVFSQLPAPLAATDKAPEDGTSPAAATSDATHEQLPDPALAPQL